VIILMRMMVKSHRAITIKQNLSQKKRNLTTCNTKTS
jgi:hypothetical protein